MQKTKEISNGVANNQKTPHQNKCGTGQGNFFYAISLGLELGFLIAVPLVAFLFLGVFLDKKFNTAPIFIASAVVVSLIATPLELRYFVLPFLEKRSQKSINN